MKTSPQIYPEDYSCIIEPQQGKGGIFIGNLEAAQNINTLHKHQIKALLTAAKGVEINHPKHQVPYFLYVPADDHESFDISRYFHQAGSFINDCIQRTNIMVHCLAGVSRSVSLVLAYLIKHKGLTYNKAYDYVKAKRKIIHPNDGFIEALKKLENECSRQSYRTRSPQQRSTSPQRQSLYLTQRVSINEEHPHSVSPTKNRMSDIQAKLSQLKQYRQGLYDSPSKNPQLYLNKYRKQETYSPQKEQPRAIQEERTGRIKRISSMMVDHEPTWDTNPKQQPINISRQRKSEYNPLQNIQNQGQFSAVNSQIDKKIEQIRKKYQEYGGGNYQSYSKYRTSTANIDENSRTRISSNVHFQNDINKGRDYYGSTYERTQLRREIGSLGVNESSHRLRKLTSLQEY